MIVSLYKRTTVKLTHQLNISQNLPISVKKNSTSATVSVKYEILATVLSPGLDRTNNHNTSTSLTPY